MMNILWRRNLKVLWPVYFILIFASVFAFATSANTDFELTNKIKSQLAQDELTRTQQITVFVKHRIVILTGTVDAESEAARAIEIAESMDDVRRVNATELQVYNSTQPLTDAYITAKVKGIFLRFNLNTKAPNMELPLNTVKIETRNGVVYLTGFVKSHGQRYQMVKLAKSIEGVKKVKPALKIKK